MREQQSRFLAHRLGTLAVTVFLISVGAALAQERPPGNPDLKREQRDREQREAMLRTAETGATIARLDERRIAAAIDQVKKDFRRIQILRNKWVRDLLAEKPLDYRRIAEEADEINERASRLKFYLMPPVAEGEPKSRKDAEEFGEAQLKEGLVQLCNRIHWFVDNPVLKNPGVVDVEQSTRAGGDLLRIIELSGALKRSAEKLRKLPK